MLRGRLQRLPDDLGGARHPRASSPRLERFRAALAMAAACGANASISRKHNRAIRRAPTLRRATNGCSPFVRAALTRSKSRHHSRGHRLRQLLRSPCPVIVFGMRGVTEHSVTHPNTSVAARTRPSRHKYILYLYLYRAASVAAPLAEARRCTPAAPKEGNERQYAQKEGRGHPLGNIGTPACAWW